MSNRVCFCVTTFVNKIKELCGPLIKCSAVFFEPQEVSETNYGFSIKPIALALEDYEGNISTFVHCQVIDLFKAQPIIYISKNRKISNDRELLYLEINCELQTGKNYEYYPTQIYTSNNIQINQDIINNKIGEKSTHLFSYEELNKNSFK